MSLEKGQELSHDLENSRDGNVSAVSLQLLD